MSLSTATRPRPTGGIPYAESQPARAARRAAPDWLPVIGWFVDDGQRHSRINVVPMGNTVDPTERFTTTLKFFRGSEQPVHTFISEPFAGDQHLSLRQRRPPGGNWRKQLRGSGRDHRAQPGKSAEPLSVGRFVARVWRRRRLAERLRAWVRLQGRHHQTGHERQVAALAGRRRERLLLHLGTTAQLPSAADSRSLRLAGPVRPGAEFGHAQLDARMPRTFELEQVIGGARELLRREGGFGSLRIWSAYKVPGFVLMRNRATGVVSSFDHTVPFAGPPID